MKRFQVTVVPQSSLFLGRGRGNRVMRHSFHYIPASTIGGALNTRFHQIGWEERLAGRFRFSNLYAGVDGGGEGVWLPAPRNLYYCPECGGGHLVRDFRPQSALDERICSKEGCPAMLRRERGVVEAVRKGDVFEVRPGRRRAAGAGVRALTVGRTELHRTTAGQVDGRLHMVEVLRVRGVTFYGDVWVEDEATEVIRPGASFRLSIGGLRSRGCGRVTVQVGSEAGGGGAEGGVLLVETPVLRLPEGGEGMAEAAGWRATIAAPYASVAVSERWAAKPLRCGKGLVSFLDTLAVGSALGAEGEVALGERMFFYRLDGAKVDLYGFERAACDGREYDGDYSFAELWTLGYGRLRWLRAAGGS